jgi:6-pyruvoyltetrahydropterin/6-carboxytetrahydropterin synthase
MQTSLDHRRDPAELGRPPRRTAPSTGLKIELGRRYRFATSHRLHTRKFSEEENVRVFGKCANPYGHGHNYVLEISVSGDVDPATGMIANLAELDDFVEREVLDVFDCRSLNEDVVAFRDVVPTTENLCIEIFKRLKSFPKAKLERVRVQETTNNSFEYDGNQKGTAS